MLFVATVAGPAAAATSLPDAEVKTARAAFDAYDSHKWKAFRDLAATIKTPRLAKVMLWYEMIRPETDASFEQIADFIDRNPDWPFQHRLRRRAEETMTVTTPRGQVLEWFARHPPVSASGMERYGDALLADGREDEARAVLRRAWVEGNFGHKQEKMFYSRYRRYLSRDDHVARLERLIWEDRGTPGRRMLWKVPKDYRALAEARLALMERRGDVDALVAKVPAHLRNHPGLLYERLRWRRIKGLDSAFEILEAAPAAVPHPEKWWIERSILARKALQNWDMSVAYRIAARHGLDAGTRFAEAEWLAGWIALRFLDDHDVALGHFAELFERVSYPVSRARAAYWAGRAATAMSDAKQAETWYETASRYPTTYYGQLAAQRLDPSFVLRLPSDPVSTAEEKEAFRTHELHQVAELLLAMGASDRMRPFLLALAGARDSGGWKVLTAELAHRSERTDLAVLVAKAAAPVAGSPLQAGYPAPAEIVRAVQEDTEYRLELPLILSLVRQESAFNPEALSGAGARGLMQLMPATAKRIARTEQLRYSKSKLTDDPAYNLSLGQAYLTRLLDRYDGSYVLTLAAYNAGPSRANRWIREFGDPRDQSVDVIDWIERIPFEETRSYVQRVLENLQVYRQRLGNTEVALTLESDLRR